MNTLTKALIIVSILLFGIAFQPKSFAWDTCPNNPALMVHSLSDCPAPTGNIDNGNMNTTDSRNNNSLSQGQAQGQAMAQGQGQTSKNANSSSADSQAGAASNNAVTVEGGHYSNRVNYEVAANRASLIVGKCQNGMDLSSVKYGLSVVSQDRACQFFFQAAAKYLSAASLQCRSIQDTMAKGRSGMTQDAQECLRKKAELFHSAELIEQEGLTLVRKQAKPGLVKRVWHALIW